MQIELYNTMLEKEGTEDEEEARRAYRVAREESDHAAEVVAGEKVSSALIEKVLFSVSTSQSLDLSLLLLLRNIHYLNLNISVCW
jgi:hypothetical protein